MISNWASGHHAKLAGQSSVYIKDNTLRGWVTMLRVDRV